MLSYNEVNNSFRLLLYNKLDKNYSEMITTLKKEFQVE